MRWIGQEDLIETHIHIYAQHPSQPGPHEISAKSLDPRERDLKEPYGGGPNPRWRSVAAYGPVSDGHI